MVVAAIAASLGLISLGMKIRRREKAPTLVCALWIAGMFAAYWKNLPFLYHEGRYMMPVLPFALLLAVDGIRMVSVFVARVSRKRRAEMIATIGLLLVIAGLNIGWSWERVMYYAESCKYITTRQVKTAHWIREHLPQDAVVATHDIGALAFYSERKIVDMVGLVSPAMIENIGRLDRLHKFLAGQNVTHLAVLQNWFESTNQNPLFQTDPREYEVMQVFEFDETRTHFTPTGAGRMTNLALRHLLRGDVSSAGPLLQKSLIIDPNNAKTHYGLGLAYLHIAKFDDTEHELRKALLLNPEYWDAELTLAEVAARRKDTASAIVRIENLIHRNPRHAAAYRALAGLSDPGDTLRVRGLIEHYRLLTGGDKVR